MSRRVPDVQGVIDEYPELYARIRAYCKFSSTRVNLDEHAAAIVLVVAGARKKQGQPPIPSRTRRLAPTKGV